LHEAGKYKFHNMNGVKMVKITKVNNSKTKLFTWSKWDLVFMRLLIKRWFCVKLNSNKFGNFDEKSNEIRWEMHVRPLQDVLWVKI